MQLTPFFTYYANLTTSLEVGVGPFGNRLIVEEMVVSSKEKDSKEK